MVRIQIVAIIFNILLLLTLLILTKRGSLKEKHSILWLLGFSCLLILSLSRGLLEKTSLFFGVYYPPSFLFLLAFFVLLLIILHFSVAISALEKKAKLLAQKMVILEENLKRLQSK